jgi:hypothetical protein
MQLHRARQDFDRVGAQLVLIGQGTPDDAARFRRAHKVELPILADAKRESYRAIGARNGTLGELLGPKVVAKGILTTLRTGAVQGRTVGHPSQLGAAAVLSSPDGEVVWSKLAEDASDNASPEEILAALSAAR